MEVLAVGSPGHLTVVAPREISVLRPQSSVLRPTPTNVQRQLRRFRRNRMALTGLALVALLVLTALLAAVIAPYPEDAAGAVHAKDSLLPPSPAHLFGTDDLGGDVFSRVVFGARYSLAIGLAIVTMAFLIGVPLGAVAGFAGGFVNELIMRVTDIFLTIPGIVLALAIGAALGPGLVNAAVALALVWWPGYCRLTRGQVLALREQTYVEAAQVVGSAQGRIVFRHILPNTLTPLIVKVSMDVGFAILTAAGLSFIGIGAQPPTPEWGAMVSTGRQFMPDWWWYATFPGLAISLAVFGFNMLGDGVRDALDPRGIR
jgi:peptide/nickel transport system permease protein